MGLSQSIDRCTPEEYLRREHLARERHQFYRGEVFAVPGGSPEHSLIIANVIGELGNPLKGKPCRVYDPNLRIRIPRTTLYTYPDVSVICGDVQFDPLDTQRQTVLNPTLLIEVLSPSTEGWDRGEKFENYQRIETLREYVLISSQTARFETYLLQPGLNWLYTSTAGTGCSAHFHSIAADLPLAEIYAGITLPESLPM